MNRVPIRRQLSLISISCMLTACSAHVDKARQIALENALVNTNYFYQVSATSEQPAHFIVGDKYNYPSSIATSYADNQ